MNPQVIACLAAGLLAAADAPKDDAATREVTQALNTLNAAFAKGDADAIKALMTDDHVAVTSYYGGARTRAEQLKSLADMKVKEYKAGEFKVSKVGKDVALVTYPVTQKGTYKGKDLAAKSLASALWVKAEGKWRERFYQETALDGK
jgi:uncharacterized protein (TIGR02246 family)